MKCDIDIILTQGSDYCPAAPIPRLRSKEVLLDKTMGVYDGAEVWELVGTYMLNVLSRKYNKNDFGLCGDDGLTVLKNKNGSQSEQVQKSIQKIFKERGLDNIIQCNMKIVNYLDVIFNLNDGIYKPYTKPNNKIKYIQKDSNHPPSSICQIPLLIKSRLSTLSYNGKILQKVLPLSKKTLQISGYKSSPINVLTKIATAPT